MAGPLENPILVPMKGVAGELPSGPGWVHEIKWDGMRVIAEVDADRVRLRSANGRDVTATYPELDGLRDLAATFGPMVLDGEAVAFADGRPDFHTLQQRIHISDPAEAALRAATTPIVYVVFDLLRLDGHDVAGLPLDDRRRLLDQLFEDGPSWRRCEQHPDGTALLDVVASMGLEGVMSKRRASTYRPGRRSPDWIKVKPRRRQEFVVGGWLTGKGSRTGSIGSLLVGVYDGGELRFAGSAGSGLTEATLKDWRMVLEPSATCPFVGRPSLPLAGRSIQWCVPTHVVEVVFASWTDDDRLRHPVVLGRRADKDAADVVREP